MRSLYAEQKERRIGFLNRLFGRREESRAQPAAPTYHGHGDKEYQPPNADEQALQRYRYLLKTAPPETIEQAHEEAFAKLTPAQRAQALRERGGARVVNFSSGAGIAGIAGDGC
jgi:hypothetical protein